MPTDYNMARTARQARKLEEKVIRFVRTRSLAPLKVISEQFGISELHAYTIISSNRDREADARERKLRNRRSIPPKIQPREAIQEETRWPRSKAAIPEADSGEEILPDGDSGPFNA